MGRTLSPEHRAKLRAAQLGRHPSAEIRARISTTLKGRAFSPEHLAKLRGRTLSPEHRAKLSATQLGRHHSVTPETLVKMRTAQLGKHHSPETRAKMSAVLMRHACSEETRAKMRLSNRRFLHGCSEETRAKMRATHLGKHHSVEARAKMSLSQRDKKPASLETRAKMRVARARQVLPFKDTKPEVAVQILLSDCGIEFTKQEHIPGLLHRWDIVIESKKTLIEVDGCYFHGCPVCKKPGARINQNDIPCTAYATENGWTVIRIRECEIKAGDFSKLVDLDAKARQT